MKFTNGYWLMRDDVEAHFAKQAYDISVQDKEIKILAPTKKIESRGDTLNLPVLTVNISAPCKNIFKVNIKHFDGSNKIIPKFEIKEDDLNIQTSESDNIFIAKNNDLEIHISKSEWLMEFRDSDGRLTDSGFKALSYIKKNDGTNYINEGLTLTPGTKVYGLGERFTSFVKNGQTVNIWNEDGGTSSEIAYKNIPFYMTNKNYGVFVADTGKVSFEVGSEKVSKVQFSVENEEMTYYFIYGKTPKEIIERYTDLTGKPSLPPAWSFGLWLTTSFTTSYDEKTVNSFIDGMLERDIPLSTFHYDCFWMREFNWCDFEWDTRMFENPPKMLERVKTKGLKICLWINPYIAQNSILFKEGKENNYLLIKENGDVYQSDLWQAGMGIVDFTNPKAAMWYKNKLKNLLDMGVDCFKTDFGERIPVNVKYYNDADPAMMHNYYTYIYNKCVFELLKEEKGEKEACLFARSATAGSQQFPVHWGGDCEATYESMAETLRGGLSLSMSGFSFWSHDISGFESTATPDLYKRWVAFGMLSTHSRLHGSDSYRVPWNFDDESSDVLRLFTKLKCRLMPYIYNQAVKASKTGVPVMRSMVMEYYDDPACEGLDMQYMLGDDLLVAPIFNDKSEACYYLPEGKFTNIITGEEYIGGKFYREKYDYMSMPLFAKENSVIPYGAIDTRADYNYHAGATFTVYNLKSQVSCEVADTLGNIRLTADFIKTGNEVSIKAKGETAIYKVLLHNVSNITKLEGAVMEKTKEGILLIDCGENIKFNLDL